MCAPASDRLERRQPTGYDADLTNAHALLLELDPWLHARCRFLAAQLPGLSADDAYQQAVEEFLRELDRWLQQDPTASVQAQARSLMAYCVQHVRTNEIRARKRAQALPESEDGDALDRLTTPVPPVDNLRAGEVLAQIRSGTTPACALCLLSLRLPALVEMDDAARAKAWRKGGSEAVPRPLPEAWDIYATGRAFPQLVSDDVAWKDRVGVAWYTEGRVDDVEAETRRAAAAKVERYANRGAEDLRETLLGGDRR